MTLPVGRKADVEVYFPVGHAQSQYKAYVTQQHICTHNYARSMGLGKQLSAHNVIILTLIALGDRPVGRKALQKLIYFATKKISANIGYKPHFYGPFSKDVAVALEDLVAIGCLNEETIKTYTYESHLYTLTPEWTKVAGEDKMTECSSYEIIHDIVKKCDDYCKLSANTLSYVAKAFYVLKDANPDKDIKITNQNVKSMGQKFGWNIPAPYLNGGFKLLSELNLVK